MCCFSTDNSTRLSQNSILLLLRSSFQNSRRAPPSILYGSLPPPPAPTGVICCFCGCMSNRLKYSRTTSSKQLPVCHGRLTCKSEFSANVEVARIIKTTGVVKVGKFGFRSLVREPNKNLQPATAEYTHEKS